MYPGGNMPDRLGPEWRDRCKVRVTYHYDGYETDPTFDELRRRSMQCGLASPEW